jgi:hypothetical protein
MALFVVLALDKSASAIQAAIIREFPEQHYRIEPGKWLIANKLMTAKQLSDRLGITSDDDDGDDDDGVTGLVVTVRGYFGRGSQDMWEWITASKSMKESV